jgi:ActR/RegA family two-component response regulator
MADKAKGIIVVNDANAAESLKATCKERGIYTQVFEDAGAALEESRKTPPQLAIVEEQVGDMLGVNFIGALLTISWTANSILISDKDHDTVHEMTEGLGVLGHLTSYSNIEELNKLLDTFDKVTAGQLSA